MRPAASCSGASTTWGSTPSTRSPSTRPTRSPGREHEVGLDAGEHVAQLDGPGGVLLGREDEHEAQLDALPSTRSTRSTRSPRRARRPAAVSCSAASTGPWTWASTRGGSTRSTRSPSTSSTVASAWWRSTRSTRSAAGGVLFGREHEGGLDALSLNQLDHLDGGGDEVALDHLDHLDGGGEHEAPLDAAGGEHEALDAGAHEVALDQLDELDELDHLDHLDGGGAHEAPLDALPLDPPDAPPIETIETGDTRRSCWGRRSRSSPRPP